MPGPEAPHIDAGRALPTDTHIHTGQEIDGFIQRTRGASFKEGLIDLAHHTRLLHHRSVRRHHDFSEIGHTVGRLRDPRQSRSEEAQQGGRAGAVGTGRNG